ncbi:MAG: Crp/Fnr family transcriptional regulator [Lachnospiraceae bacterium]|nr:Crp/Fnr family transcriptional regulator [Lachnospiraceae bacterium]
MASKRIPAGQTFIQAGQALECFWYITEGSMQAQFPGGFITLEKGDIVGICDFNRQTHTLSYQAVTDCMIIPYGSPAVLIRTKFFEEHIDNRTRFAVTMNRFVRKTLEKYTITWRSCKQLYDFLSSSYASYRKLCEELHIVIKALPGIDTLEPMESDLTPALWQTSYYAGLHNILLNKTAAPILQENQFVPGYLYHAMGDIHTLLGKFQSVYDYAKEISYLLLNEDRLDLFDLFTGMYFRIGMQHPRSSAISLAIETICSHVEKQPGIPPHLAEGRLQEYHSQMENMKKLMDNPAISDIQADFQKDYSLPGKLAGSVDIILEYADCTPEVTSAMKNALASYKQLPDKNATTPEVMKLRQTLTKYFYEIYSAAFQVSLMDENIPPILKMFFNFGYMDADLCGMDNACYLYQNVQHYSGSAEHGIYTTHEWLKAIYAGEKEPSINELDVDYEKHVQTMKNEGTINAETAKQMLEDRAQKVLFELDNMFPRASKITSGKPAVFCPILSEHEFIRQPEDALLYPDLIVKVLESIRGADYTVFARTNLTMLSQKENIHDFFNVEIMPDIILMPVIGMRGAMWQEIVGRSRMTAARMMLPIFQLEDLQKIMIRMIGEYRWEMCKRVQGARWNDVTEPSLTSLYYDFLQFYRKNPELSTDTKEKIKTGLQKCKNNFKEYFLNDYATYILFESKGSPHLTKNARAILFSQCPLSAPIRKTLSSNPIYQELLEAHGRSVAERCKKLDNLSKKLIAKQEKVPEVLDQEIEFTKR